MLDAAIGRRRMPIKPRKGGKEGKKGRKGKKRGSGSAGLVEEKQRGRGGRERSGPESKVPFGCAFACARTGSSPDTHTRTHTHAARWNEAKPVRGPAPSFFCPCLHTFLSNPDPKSVFGFETTFKGDSRRASSRFGAQLWRRASTLSRDTFAGRVT